MMTQHQSEHAVHQHSSAVGTAVIEHAPPSPTHRGNLDDPRDMDHQVMSGAEHASHGAASGHGGGHAGHAEAFQRRF